jgi:hypothetical protein
MLGLIDLQYSYWFEYKNEGANVNLLVVGMGLILAAEHGAVRAGLTPLNAD